MPKIEKKDAVLLKEKEDPAKQQKVCTGKISGRYWVWPSGKKTHLSVIWRTVHAKRPLPVGFYTQIELQYGANMEWMGMVRRCKEMGLQCTASEELKADG